MSQKLDRGRAIGVIFKTKLNFFRQGCLRFFDRTDFCPTEWGSERTAEKDAYIPFPASILYWKGNLIHYVSRITRITINKHRNRNS